MPISLEVHIKGPLPEAIPSLHFLDYNPQEKLQFPELQLESYTKIVEDDQDNQIVQPKPQVCSMYKSNTMALLDIPYFGQSPQIKSYVQFLLSQLDGSLLQLDQPYHINANLMHKVYSLCQNREDATLAILEKDASTTKLNEIYNTHHGARGSLITTINDPSAYFMTQLLACKMIQKYDREECSVGVIIVVEFCVQGIKMAQDWFLMNEFIQDCMDSQDLGK